MQREPLFFLEGLTSVGETAVLSDAEARHAVGARRLRVADVLQLFDGHGNVCPATITEIDKQKKIHLRLGEYRSTPRPRPSVHLACALPKGDRQAVLLDMATQLGMSRFTPLVCTHSVVKSTARARPRWRRICLEACKQSRRTYLPILNDPATPVEAAARALTQGETVWIAHPASEGSSLADWNAKALPAAMTILIGPEGGFTEDELQQVVGAGGQPVHLGPAVLRIETAAVALLAGVLTRVE